MKVFLSKLCTNIFSKNIKGRYIVFESDDWGSIRIPSYQSILNLKRNNIDLTRNPYTSLDGLECNQDLEYLFEVLTSYKDNDGCFPILTANFVTHNPDFEKIKKSAYNNYSNQDILSTYDFYSNSNHVIYLFKQAYKNGIVLPQFHGREHVNVELWMNLLRLKVKNFLLAFDQNIFGIDFPINNDIKKNIQATYDTTDYNYIKDSIAEGLKEFEHIFGFKSSSFIPNNYIFPSLLFKYLYDNKIYVLQGMGYHLEPLDSSNIRKKHFRFNGSLNDSKQINIVRNCVFEPSLTQDGYLKTMNDIEMAFRLSQPAVISTHRINFTSRISQKNRDKNLLELKYLLQNILKKWPDVKFVSTIDLANLYHSNY